MDEGCRCRCLAAVQYEGYAWGMSIDQNVCTGCSACVVACVAENNIPASGKGQVNNGRRDALAAHRPVLQRDIDNPETYHQPMPSEQWQNASCEWSARGRDHAQRRSLNDMSNNRCVARGTARTTVRTRCASSTSCSTGLDTQSYWPMRNPDVTVRSRGVMEKCTYWCSASAARIAAKLDDRQIRDGEVLTACQSACRQRDRVRQHQRSNAQ